jgi:phosphatidate cytidylyltransferase
LLIQRVASAAAGIPIIIALIWLGGNWYTAAVAALMAVASLEFTHLRRGWFEPVCVLTALVVAGVIVGAHGDEIQWGLWLAGATVVAAVAAAINPTDDGPTLDAAWASGGVLYVAYLGSFLVLLRDSDDGRSWAYLALLATFAVDTAAYFTGRAIGTHKLAPKISPKKTVEGFVGGWVAGALAVVALHYAFDLGFAFQHVVALGVALPLAATVGDLLESAIKRMEQVKDASELIPGHGGVLDRFDSLLFTFPLVYLFVQWFG